MATVYRKYFLKKVKIIVVVGSLGKTTTTTAIKYLLGLKVNNKFESNAFGSVALQLCKIKRTTKYMVIEVGIARKGDMANYAKMIRPDAVVLTAIASEHVSSFGSIEEIRNEKLKILQGPVAPQVVFLNGDDPNVIKMTESINISKMTFGMNSSNQYRCLSYTLKWPDGYHVVVKSKNINESFQVHLYGEQMINCFLAALAVAEYYGVIIPEIRERTLNIQPVNGRMQVVRLPNKAILIRDEFKSSLETIPAALHFLNQVPAKRKIVILGTVSYLTGSARKVYQELGTMIGKVANEMFVISMPDYEQAITAATKRAGLTAGHIHKTKDDWTKIPDILDQLLLEGDVILVKGKHEQRLERLSLAIQGEKVRCTIKNCDLKYIYCKDCSRLK